ncbi:MAG: ion transporter [Bacteroidales bacterium]|nr:ion transporter [Bacteroidales bacterium]
MNKKISKILFEIIFEADTKIGKLFDISLLIAIFLSVLTVICESIPAVRRLYSFEFLFLEWIFTIIFTIEYILRIYASPKRVKYLFSFYGIIDMLAILPTYVGIFITGAHGFIVIRAFRLLRIFRVLKISRYSNAGNSLMVALKASLEKIGVFLFSVLTIILLIGTLMYMIEGEKNGFTSIPKSIYWAIVTLTTVGYGDITPQTAIGQFISGILMIIGYAIIAVPTGIISVEAARAAFIKESAQICPGCLKEGHDVDSKYCKYCGTKLND